VSLPHLGAVLNRWFVVPNRLLNSDISIAQQSAWKDSTPPTETASLSGTK